ncbi:InlB B-repeat-containing protein [Paenibacillus agaridevorans]|uniref:InlB B-repeat-containing protein n=1 Tax=Paenibacillus agaridevorans TaxID=171404 RepID=UPI001BE40091|nr:InlB B-repeat-containing protein [Paenibacillus agaridevorans]
MTYNGNGSTGGSVPLDSDAYEAGETVNVLDKGTLVKVGHTFAGWNTLANGTGTNYAAGAKLTMGAANVTLYAKWTPNPSYTVTYNGNGSTGGSVPVDSEAYEVGETVNVLDKGTLVKAGHTFAGWNTLANGSGTNYASGATLTMGASNVTLYAKWTPNPTYTVTYNGNGSTGGSVPLDSDAYEAGETVNVLDKSTLVKVGHTFAGWNTLANGTGTNYAAGATLNMGAANVTLYAQWTENPTYTMAYNGNGSTGGSVPVDSEAYEAGETVNVLDKGTLVKVGHTFAGWNTASDGVGTDYAAGATLTMGTTNVTLYAQWTENPMYTVTYNGNESTGGSVPVDSEAYEAGETVNVLDKGTLVRAGHTFAGWNTASDGVGTDYAAGATLTMGTTNVTLYAQWRPSGSTGGGPAAPGKHTSSNGKLTLPAGAIGEVSFGHVVEIYIPAGATDKPIDITIGAETRNEQLNLQDNHPVSGVFNIWKSIADKFKKMVTIAFSFDPAKLSEGQQPAVFYYDEAKRQWMEIAGGKVVDNWISVEVDQFGLFAVMCVEIVNGRHVLCSSPVQSPEFSDVPGHWAANAIHEAVKRGFVKGYPDGTFKPNHTVTRGEFAVMLMNALKEQVEGTELKFTDAAKIPAWAKGAVAQAVQAGIINGYQDDTFRPVAEITRAEMAVMIASALKLSAQQNAATGFADDQSIPTWAKGAVAALKNLGIIGGKDENTFEPSGKATRAEAVTVIMNMLAKKG